MGDEKPHNGEGREGESEAVHAPRRDPDPPTGSRAQPAAWLIGIGIIVVLTLGFLVGWGLGMLDLPG